MNGGRLRCTIAILVLLLVAAFSFAGGESESTTQESSDRSQFEGAVVNALIFRSLDSDYISEELAPRLKAETGIDLRVDAVPYEQVRGKQLADARGAKSYDIVNTTTEWSFEYRQFTQPLNPYIGTEGYPDIEKEDIIPFVWEEFNPDPLAVHWIPYQPDTRIFFYRIDLLEEAGIDPPETWEELLSAAEALTQDTDRDGNVDQYGFVFPARRGWNLTLAWAPFLFGAGGTLFEDGEPAFNSQAGVDAINLLRELKQYAPPDIDTFGEYEVNQTVKSGSIAMGVSATAITPEIEAPNSPVRGKIATTVFPKQSRDTERDYIAVLGGWGLGVSEYSENPDAAAYAVMWLTSREIVTDMQVHGRQHAARLSMAENPELLAVNPHVPTIVDILAESTLFYKGKEGAAIGELLNVRIAQAISGELSPRAALDTAADEIRTLLGQ